MVAPAALVDLVARRRRDMVLFARSLVHDPDAAEDIVQEALLKAWRFLPDDATAQKHGGLDRWVFRIIRTTFLDSRRRGYVLHEIASDEVPEGRIEATEGDVLAEELRAEILAGIEQLSAKMAAVMRLRVDEFDNAAISAKLGISAESARCHTHRGRVALRALLRGGRAARA